MKGEFPLLHSGGGGGGEGKIKIHIFRQTTTKFTLKRASVKEFVKDILLEEGKLSLKWFEIQEEMAKNT